MPNHWTQNGIPHKGWTLENVIDIREDGQAEWETNYEICMMCGNERIRYVHILTHPEVSSEFKVGCTCAEKMTNDYINHKEREQYLRNKAGRRANWINKQWKSSRKGTSYIKIEGKLLCIFKDKKTDKYKVKIADTFGRRTFASIEEAKIAAFNGIEHLKRKNLW